MNNLRMKAEEAAILFIREIINKFRCDDSVETINLKFEGKTFKEAAEIFWEKLDLPINYEERVYNAEPKHFPTRYIITSPELACLFSNGKKVEHMLLPYYGNKCGYDIFAECLLPRGTFLVLEDIRNADGDDDVKVIKKAHINLF